MNDPQHEETFADTERKLRETITTLRAQLAEADELIEAQAKDHASNNIRLAEASYRAERAEQRVATLEAALAAQIEVGMETCGQCMGSGYGGHPDSGYSCHVCGGSGGVRNQPNDRTALDRMLAEAREKALRMAADELRGQGYGAVVRAILALIEDPNAR